MAADPWGAGPAFSGAYMSTDQEPLAGRFLKQLAREFPNRYAVLSELINLEAIENLPKGTEHFISDVHGEYEAFRHILNNCSGVVRDKVDMLFPELTATERSKLCTLIYYPKESLSLLEEQGITTHEWYLDLLHKLILLATFLSSKYTRSKVRRAIPKDFAFVIDELMHAKADEDNNRLRYHGEIFDAIIQNESGDYFIEALSSLIKRLAVDRLHVLGDLYDRGPHADRVVDLLKRYHNLDLQWGNHEALWLGAACGSEVCAATAVRNNVNYRNYELLENGYGISLRQLVLFARQTYTEEPNYSALFKAISIITLKLQGEVIKRNPEFGLENRLLLNAIDYEKGTVNLEGRVYQLGTADLPTINPQNPYELTEEERAVVKDLRHSFVHSRRLRDHAAFIARKGSMYLCHNGNLLYHGCIPLNDDGTFERILCRGKYLSGRAYLDYCDRVVRDAVSYKRREDVDFLWYLWCGEKSPLSGRVIKTFERSLIADKNAWHEPRNPYYVHYYSEDTCAMILREFGLNPQSGHIINGHTPIKVKDGEKPVRAGGRLLVIDGGFSRAYHETTGIAGYTLIYNSHNLRLKSHHPFTSLEDALKRNVDIRSEEIVVEQFKKRRMVADSDDGREIAQRILDLKMLLLAYQKGELPESAVDFD